MREEILQMKGRLAEARKRLSDLDIEASGLLTLIRLSLNPWESDLTRLRIPEAAQAMQRLLACYHEMAALRSEIARMEEALG